MTAVGQNRSFNDSDLPRRCNSAYVGRSALLAIAFD